MQIDKQIVRQPETNQIDHAESAKENLGEAAGNLYSALLPEKFAIGLFGDFFGGILNCIMGNKDDSFGAEMFKGLAKDIFVDPIVQPLCMVKNLGDAAVHGVIAGFQKIAD
ncbi:hypothetical protein ACFL59_05130 [Planctomycetota bacterium]